MKSQIWKVLFLGFFLLQAGCGSTYRVEPRQSNPSVQEGILAGAIMGGLMGAANGGFASYMLVGGTLGGMMAAPWGDFVQQTAGVVNMEQIGDRYRLILPTDLFFLSFSSDINPYYYPELHSIANFMKKFPNQTFVIAGYSDNVFSKSVSKKLTQAQAERIAAFLWSEGIHSTYLQPIGLCQKTTLADNTDPVGRCFNRRVEITWELSGRK